MEHDNISELIFNFSKISDKGWIKGITSGTSSIGLTFENELGIPQQNFEIPDFNNIEIKTHSDFSKFPISLFNAAPDGSSFFEVKRITSLYGYPHKFEKHYKVFSGNVNSSKPKFIGSDFKFKLFINKKSGLINLQVYNNQNVFIENNTSWSFSMLEQKLFRKLQYLALIKASTKRIGGIKYFKYNTIQIYKLIDFNAFIAAIENGHIIINFSVGVFLSGKRVGQLHDHGTAFRINEKNIEKVFKKLP